jgi:hypothetical protein
LHNEQMGQGRTHPLGIAGGLCGKALECWWDGWCAHGLSRRSGPCHVRPGVAFPPVGRVGLTSPRSSGLCAAQIAPLPVLRRFARRSRSPYLAGFRRSWSPFPARGPLEAPRGHARVVEFAGSPTPATVPRRPVALPSSRVPPVLTGPARRPRWCPEPSPARVQDGGLPLQATRRRSPRGRGAISLRTTTIPMSGLKHAACHLAPPSSAPPWLALHVGFATALLARRWSGGT